MKWYGIWYTDGRKEIYEANDYTEAEAHAKEIGSPSNIEKLKAKNASDAFKEMWEV